MRHRTNQKRKWAAGATDGAGLDHDLPLKELPNRPITRRNVGKLDPKLLDPELPSRPITRRNIGKLDPKLVDPELPSRPITRRDIRNMPKRPAP